MKIQLVCSEEKRETLKEMLSEKGFEIVEKSDYLFIDKSTTDKKYIFGKDSQKVMTLINYPAVLYFETNNKTTEVIADSGCYEVSEKLYELEQQLYHEDFVRISKSVIVNLMNVKKIIPWIGSKFVLQMKNGDEIEVTRTYFSDFKKRLGL